MWFKDYMEDFLLQIIRAFVFNNIVDVNKVFITGYSAGEMEFIIWLLEWQVILQAAQ